MTHREKVLTTGLLGVLLLFGGGFLFHLFVYEPVSEVRTRLELERKELQDKKNELAVEEKQIKDILEVNPRLMQWTQLSLPPRDPELKNLPLDEQKFKHFAKLRGDYVQYLRALMDNAGIKTVSVTPGTTGRAAPTTAQGKAKEPPFEQLTFVAVGQGKMDDVVRTMRAFHRTPLLHHIRTVSLDLVGDKGGKKVDGLLEMTLTIDALLMPGAEDRTGLEPKALAITPRVLAYDPKLEDRPERNYLVMNKRNMFTGFVPTPPPVVRKDPETPKVVTEDKVEVLRFVRLTSLSWDTERDRWEACLRDQGKGGREKQLNTGTRDEFTITDKDDNTMLEAKVVMIEEQFMVILTEGKYYRLRSGDFLYPAIRSPLSKAELKAMGITPDESAKEK